MFQITPNLNQNILPNILKTVRANNIPMHIDYIKKDSKTDNQAENPKFKQHNQYIRSTYIYHND